MRRGEGRRARGAKEAAVAARCRTPGGLPVGDDGRGGAEPGLGLAGCWAGPVGGGDYFFKTISR